MHLLARTQTLQPSSRTDQTAVGVCMIVAVQYRARTVFSTIAGDRGGRPNLPETVGRTPVTPAGFKAAVKLRHFGYHLDIIDIPAGALRHVG